MKFYIGSYETILNYEATLNHSVVFWTVFGLTSTPNNVGHISLSHFLDRHIQWVSEVLKAN